MAEKEYIERGAVLALKQSIGAYGMDICSAEVKEIPAADVEEVKHGKWVHEHYASGYSWIMCSECNTVIHKILTGGNHLNYCPNCGAKMDGGSQC